MAIWEQEDLILSLFSNQTSQPSPDGSHMATQMIPTECGSAGERHGQGSLSAAVALTHDMFSYYTALNVTNDCLFIVWCCIPFLLCLISIQTFNGLLLSWPNLPREDKRLQSQGTSWLNKGYIQCLKLCSKQRTSGENESLLCFFPVQIQNCWPAGWSEKSEPGINKRYEWWSENCKHTIDMQLVKLCLEIPVLLYTHCASMVLHNDWKVLQNGDKIKTNHEVPT